MVRAWDVVTTATPASTPAGSTAANGTQASTGSVTDTKSAQAKNDTPADKNAKKSDAPVEKTDAMPSPGEDLDPHIKKGSEDDVDAVGTAEHRRPRDGELVLDQLGDRDGQAVLDGD